MSFAILGAGLIQDAAGNLYGTTSGGGLSGCFGDGCGVVFELTPIQSGWTETVLYSFTGGTDGWDPQSPLVRDQQGNLYGTTYFGGDQGSFCAGFCGVVFKLTAAGQETVLYAFTGQADGEEPFAGLLRDGNGNLYGTTQYGGDLGSQQGYCSGLGCGVVFKLSACHTALCHGEDDADTATATTNRATVTQHPSTAASANPALRDRRFPGNRPLGTAIGPTN